MILCPIACRTDPMPQVCLTPQARACCLQGWIHLGGELMTWTLLALSRALCNLKPYSSTMASPSSTSCSATRSPAVTSLSSSEPSAAMKMAGTSPLVSGI